jgi:chorismate synthase
MSSEFGERVKVTIFGQSHGQAIGVVIDGLPAGEAIDEEELYAFMSRRRPGKNRLSTQRSESDIPRFISGVEGGLTCGAPLCAVIENKDMCSRDYEKLKNIPRPGHADFTAYEKWGGMADMRGGGHFSGRLTAPLCVAGGIAKQILGRRGIYIGAHLLSVGGETDEGFPLYPENALFETIAKKDFPVISDEAGERMKAVITKAANEQDSVGGVIECAVTGMEAGFGSPMFGTVEGRLSYALFGVPAVKGVEFGAGFRAAALRGSENNDPFRLENGRVVTETNHAVGILGGITTGMPILFRAAFKPTPSIAKEQQSVDLKTGQNTTITIPGRHDPCIVPRAVPVIEAAAAIAVYDAYLNRKKET